MPERMRWGVLGTANIAAKAFLAALRETGGVAAVVGSRSETRGPGLGRRERCDAGRHL